MRYYFIVVSGCLPCLSTIFGACRETADTFYFINLYEPWDSLVSLTLTFSEKLDILLFVVVSADLIAFPTFAVDAAILWAASSFFICYFNKLWYDIIELKMKGKHYA